MKLRLLISLWYLGLPNVDTALAMEKGGRREGQNKVKWKTLDLLLQALQVEEGHEPGHAGNPLQLE